MDEVKAVTNDSEVKIVSPETSMKLDFACGQNVREGFEGVDLYAPNAKYKVDLWKFPFPWETSSIAELHCSHFIEHLPARTVEATDTGLWSNCAPDYLDPAEYVGKDFLFAFFDECWRILKPGGVITIITPNARSNRAFQDPTHRRFIVAETFCYLSDVWRKSQKLDHYNVKCNFDGPVNPIIPEELGLLHPEAQARRFNESWNTIFDWMAVLKAIK